MDSKKLNKIIIAIIAFIVIITVVLFTSTSTTKDIAEIKLLGNDKITLHQYDNYVEYGYKIINQLDNESYNVKVEGIVNTNSIGEYTIIYNLYNSKNELLSSATRKVFVYEDDLFIGYDKTNELGFVENDFTKEDMEDMNNNISIDSVLYLKKEQFVQYISELSGLKKHCPPS